jgi:hypothetical protein
MSEDQQHASEIRAIQDIAISLSAQLAVANSGISCLMETSSSILRAHLNLKSEFDDMQIGFSALLDILEEEAVVSLKAHRAITGLRQSKYDQLLAAAVDKKRNDAELRAAKLN